MNLRLAFTVGGLHPEYGGPSRSVTSLAGALGRGGAAVELVSLHNGPGWQPPVIPPEPEVRTTLVDASSVLARKSRWTPRFRKTLRERCRAGGAQLLHDAGVWLPTNHAAAAVAAELKLPFIVSPRGMLIRWAIEHRAWKKRLAWNLYQGRDLRSARLLHATSTAEAEDFRALGLVQPIAVVPNGVEFPPLSLPERAPGGRAVRTVLFMGRVHPKKGLDDLVSAWAAVRPAGWRVLIAGGDEQGHRAELEAKVDRLGLQNDFEFLGLVADAQRWEMYRRADLFVLPSRSENFGLVVAEALACGLPVVATQGAPWKDLETHRCGWWIPNDTGALAAALRQACTASDAERHEMGLRGRALVEREYTWNRAADRLREVYAWVLGLAPRPDCVID